MINKNHSSLRQLINLFTGESLFQRESAPFSRLISSFSSKKSSSRRRLMFLLCLTTWFCRLIMALLWGVYSLKELFNVSLEFYIFMKGVFSVFTSFDWFKSTLIDDWVLLVLSLLLLGVTRERKVFFFGVENLWFL